MRLGHLHCPRTGGFFSDQGKHGARRVSTVQHSLKECHVCYTIYVVPCVQHIHFYLQYKLDQWETVYATFSVANIIDV